MYAIKTTIDVSAKKSSLLRKTNKIFFCVIYHHQAALNRNFFSSLKIFYSELSFYLPQKLFSDFSEKKISGRYFGGKREIVVLGESSILASRFFRLFYLFKWSGFNMKTPLKNFAKRLNNSKPNQHICVLNFHNSHLLFHITSQEIILLIEIYFYQYPY